MNMQPTSLMVQISADPFYYSSESSPPPWGIKTSFRIK